MINHKWLPKNDPRNRNIYRRRNREFKNMVTKNKNEMWERKSVKN